MLTSQQESLESNLFKKKKMSQAEKHRGWIRMRNLSNVKIAIQVLIRFPKIKWEYTTALMAKSLAPSQFTKKPKFRSDFASFFPRQKDWLVIWRILFCEASEKGSLGQSPVWELSLASPLSRLTHNFSFISIHFFRGLVVLTFQLQKWALMQNGVGT